jgi:hypothetical protein
MPEAETKFSKFNVTSYGGGESEQTKSIPSRIDLLRLRILDLSTNINELGMRPRMPYTQGHSEGQVLVLADNGNDEPDWEDDFFPTTGSPSDTTKQLTSTFITNGTRKNKRKTTTKHQIFQPWISVTVPGGNTVADGTDTSTTTPTTPTNPTTTTISSTKASGLARKGKVYHWESTTPGSSTWV